MECQEDHSALQEQLTILWILMANQNFMILMFFYVQVEYGRYY